MSTSETTSSVIDRHAPYFRLPYDFDPLRLKAECDAIAEEDWIPHYNQNDYSGEWTIVALHAIGGRKDMIFSNPNPPIPYSHTPTLLNSPYLKECLDHFRCPLQTVRLMRLAPGSSIKEHNDDGLGWAYGQARIHVPIETSPDIGFYVGNERVDMKPGECWYMNFDLLHRVENRSTTPRTHLVIDTIVDPWLDELLSKAAGQAAG